MLVKPPIKKPKKTYLKKSSYWSKKADKLLQEIGRDIYQDDGCLICGGEYSCLHHIITKGSSTYLRYNWKNVIPICAKHHFKIHSHEPTDVKSLMDKIIDIKGREWFEDLQAERNKNRYVKAGYAYYRDIYEKLKLTKPYKVC